MNFGGTGMGLLNWLFDKKNAQTSANSWKMGDRVLAKKIDSYFYPGQVRETSEVGCLIVFDDNDAGWVHCAHVLSPDVRIGSRVFCRNKQAPNFAPGTVKQQKGETILVSYDHGGEEWTSVSMVRVQRPIAPVSPEALASANVPVKQMIDLGDAVKDSNWRVGDRVLARWMDYFWYPGTVLNLGERGIHVLFDDGDQRVVQESQIMPLNIEEGEQIFIRPKMEPQKIYMPATVSRVEGERIDVDLEDGESEQNTRASRARFWRCPVGIGAVNLEEGDRVLAYDSDECVYPADVVLIEDDIRIIVQYLDGLERMLTPELVRKFDLKTGAKIECRWAGGPHYFPGTLDRIEGERVHVKYDDGDDEWTSLRLLRIPAKRPPMQ